MWIGNEANSIRQNAIYQITKETIWKVNVLEIKRSMDTKQNVCMKTIREELWT